jgi:hypothetical protein
MAQVTVARVVAVFSLLSLGLPHITAVAAVVVVTFMYMDQAAPVVRVEAGMAGMEMVVKQQVEPPAYPVRQIRAAAVVADHITAQEQVIAVVTAVQA